MGQRSCPVRVTTRPKGLGRSVKVPTALSPSTVEAMSAPTVTAGVVIPCLNDAAMLRDCLLALTHQNRLPDEIVVVDNGSTDNSVEVAHSFGARVLHEPVRGIWPASATGFDTIGTDLIFRVDADSLPKPDWLEEGVRQFADDPQLDLLVGPGDFYGDKAWANWVGTNLYVGALRPIWNPYLGHACPFGSNLGFRKEVWAQIRNQVTKHTAEVHDDMDMGYHIEPWMNTKYNHYWRMPVSARPFDSWASFGRRLRLVERTLQANWPEARPFVHRRRRYHWRRALRMD